MAARFVLPLIPKATCPHCWFNFDPADVLWISAHQDLVGDPRLGPDEQLRFLPTAFNPEGQALDLRGVPCRTVACPSCHLPLPRAVLEYEPLFVSILGTPSCGKSYFLATLSWQMRQLLPKHFAISFADADPTVNLGITEAEKKLFLSERPEKLLPLANLIEKTKLAGDLYDVIYEGDHAIRYLKPFLFTLRPNEKHPSADRADDLARLVVLYDNAGEHFMPGREEPNAPVTQHLAKSQLLLFLFDPTQDPRFRRLYEKGNPNAALMNLRSERQDVVLREAAARVRRLAGLTTGEKHRQPLVVIVTKCDAWQDLLAEDFGKEPWLVKNGFAGLDREGIAKRSAALRSLLDKTCPEVVVAAEEFAEEVIYMPVSALGKAPSPMKADGKNGQPVNIPGIRPIDIRPRGVIVPFLHALNSAVPGLIMSVKRQGTRATIEAPRKSATTWWQKA